MKEKRTQDRISGRYQVHFGPEGAPYIGFIKNLSKSGVAISSRTVYKPGTFLNMMIQTDSKSIFTSGYVRWSYRSERLIDIEGSFDMGVMFDKSNPDYINFFENHKKNFMEGRRDPRFEKVYKVSFKTPKEFMQAYTQNISLGGLFIITEEPLENDSIVEVEIEMTDISETIRVEAKVVFIVDEALSKKLGLGVGVGVKIVKYFNDGKEKLQKLLGKWY